MGRSTLFVLFFCAVFLQAGAYGLTFLLPPLFESFGADEKVVGSMLFVTTISTLITVYFSGHLSDWFGRVTTLCLACAAIALALFLFGLATRVGPKLVSASIFLGFGWGLTYTLSPIVLTRLVNADQRVAYFTLLSVFVMAGFGLSPVLASFIESAGYGIKNAFHFTAMLCLISAAILFSLKSAINRHAINQRTETPSRLSLSGVGKVINSQALLPVIMVFLGAAVFAGMNNFQTVIAGERSLNYTTFFLVYTITVVVFRILLVRYNGGKNPYLTISILQYVMFGSIALFLISADNQSLYIAVAFLFGIGYGVSYPILAAMAANDAPEQLVPQTLQFFALSYFVGIFGFPLVAGWLIVEYGSDMLLMFVAGLAAIEASLAFQRAIRSKKKQVNS